MNWAFIVAVSVCWPLAAFAAVTGVGMLLMAVTEEEFRATATTLGLLLTVISVFLALSPLMAWGS